MANNGFNVGNILTKKIEINKDIKFKAPTPNINFINIFNLSTALNVKKPFKKNASIKVQMNVRLRAI